MKFVQSVPEKIKIFLNSKKVDDEYTKYGIIDYYEGQNLLLWENKHGGWAWQIRKDDAEEEVD